MYHHTPALMRTLIKSAYQGHPLFPVTVTAAGDDIAETTTFDVAYNQYLLVHFACRLVKGGAAGDSRIVVRQVLGTGRLSRAGVTLTTQPMLYRLPSIPAAGDWEIESSVLFQVTLAGTMRIGLKGFSFGSDSTANPGECFVGAYLFF